MRSPPSRPAHTQHPGGRDAPAGRITSLDTASAATAPLAHLLALESEARRAPTKPELDGLIVNEGRKLLRARQVILLELRRPRAVVTALSGVGKVDRASLMVGWIEDMAQRIEKAEGVARPLEFELPAYAAPEDALTRDYPFRWMMFQPLWSPSGKSTAAALLIRDAPWLESDRKIAARLAEAFGHARALLDASGRPPRSRPRARLWVAAAAIVLAAGALHVPISVLAPLEVVPRSADVIAMPVEGIVHKVLVEPNAAVSAGTVLVQLVDTTARNKAAVAEQEAAVAAARVEKATSLAFTDPRGRQELGVARAELALKLAERTYARDLLAQTSIKAERAGIAVFSDRRDLEGKPLGVGERLMLVARESAAELKISLPVADSIVLRPGLRVKAFLDSAPLAVAEAHIAHVDFQARLDEMRNATYVVTARLDDPNVHPALGARGTAQIVGDRAPLALYLLRRPLVALRQRFGL